MKMRFVAVSLSIAVLSLAHTAVLAQSEKGEAEKPAATVEPEKAASPTEPDKQASPQEPAKRVTTGQSARRVSAGEPVRRVSMSVGSRTAACRKDCSTGNLHGTYRVYGASDPQLKSPEGQKLYAECVRLCLDPLPGFYFQKSTVESGGSWFGKKMGDCLGCHAVGKPKRYWPGINTIPENLKRDSSTR